MSSQEPQTSSGINRRTLVARGAAITAGVWAAPVVTAFTSPALAGSPFPPAPGCPVYFPFFANADQEGPLVCQGSNPQPAGACVQGNEASECAQVISAERTGGTILFCIQASCRDILNVYVTTESGACVVVSPGLFSPTCYRLDDVEGDRITSFQPQLECGANCPA